MLFIFKRGLKRTTLNMEKTPVFHKCMRLSALQAHAFATSAFNFLVSCETSFAQSIVILLQYYRTDSTGRGQSQTDN